MRTTTRNDTATNADRSECPPWCDPSQHLTDDNDTTLIVLHRSRPTATAGLGSPRLQQTVRRFGPRVVRSPITISVEPAERVELHDRDEADDFLKELTRALVSLTNQAWTADRSTLASRPSAHRDFLRALSLMTAPIDFDKPRVRADCPTTRQSATVARWV